MELRLDIPKKQCLKCEYVRQEADTGPDYSCPRCGAVYAKLEMARQARVEATELEEREERNAGIRARSHQAFEASQRERDEQELPRRLAAHLIYLMYALPFAITQVLAIGLAYRMRQPGEESWLNDHFVWQIRTFWYLLPLVLGGLLALLVGGISTSVFVATRRTDFLQAALDSIYILAVMGAFIVLIYLFRVIKGWYGLWRQESPW